MLQQDSDRITHAIDRVTTAITGTGLVLSENLAQVNGATVNVGTGAAGSGTQRVTTSTDSTIGTVTAVTAITNTVNVAFATSAQVLASSTVTDSTASPVVAGTTAVGFTTSSTFVGTINGIARSASTFYSFDAAAAKTLPSIAYTVTAGSMIIDKLT